MNFFQLQIVYVHNGPESIIQTDNDVQRRIRDSKKNQMIQNSVWFFIRRTVMNNDFSGLWGQGDFPYLCDFCENFDVASIVFIILSADEHSTWIPFLQRLAIDLHSYWDKRIRKLSIPPYADYFQKQLLQSIEFHEQIFNHLDR